jgi:hypothetical protein
MKKITVFFLVLALFLTSCVSIGRKKINNAGDVAKGQVLVVGKIVYDPPMTKDTQDLRFIGDDTIRYRTWLICGTKLRTIDKSAVNPGSPDLSGSIETVQNQTFYTTNNNYPIYIIGGIFYKEVYTESCGYNCTEQVFNGVLVPASFYLDIKADDQAIYVGTIKYTRDNFWNITNIQIIDDYNKELPAFKAKFPGFKLRKALIRQPDKGVVPEVGTSY